MNSALREESRWAGLREVLTMAWPIVLGSLSFTFMQFVDQYMVSWLGIEALAAVGSSGIWAATMAFFFVGVAGCVSTFVAQSLGRGDPENCSSFTWQGIYVSLAAGMVAVCIWPVSPFLFAAMGHSSEVTRLEVIYFQIRLFGYIFIGWQAALAAFFQATNKPVIPMCVALVANVVNVILDYGLIFGHFGMPEWGIGGAAAATVIALIIQVVLLQWIFMSDAVHAKYRSRTTFRFDLRKAKDLVKIGWPSGMSGVLDIASWAVFISFIVGQFGTTQLAAQNAAINFMHLQFLPAVGLSHAVTPIVGHWIGRGNYAVARARTYTAVKIGIVYMLVVGAVLATFGNELIGVFSDDPEVRAVGHMLLIFAAIFAGFDAISIVITGALRGAGDTRFIMVALLIGSYGVSLPLAYFFAVILGLKAIGAWIGATIYIILLSGVFLARFKGTTWEKIQIFSPPIPESAQSFTAPLTTDHSEMG